MEKSCFPRLPPPDQREFLLLVLTGLSAGQLSKADTISQMGHCWHQHLALSILTCYETHLSRSSAARPPQRDISISRTMRGLPTHRSPGERSLQKLREQELLPSAYMIQTRSISDDSASPQFSLWGKKGNYLSYVMGLPRPN